MCYMVTHIYLGVDSMAKPKYTIQEQDFSLVSDYIRKRLFDSDGAWIADKIDSENGATYREAEDSFKKCRDCVTLNNWCEIYLTKERWTQLKNALRAARKRERARTDKIDPVVNVSLSRKAWIILRDLAKSENQTLSDYIIQNHKEDWVKLPSDK